MMSPFEPDCLYQHPLDHTEIQEIIMQVGQMYLNACPGFCLLIWVCVEQMAKA